jgi:hypothetical protein
MCGCRSYFKNYKQCRKSGYCRFDQRGNSAALAMSTPELRRQKSHQRNLAFLEGKKIGLIDHSVLK